MSFIEIEAERKASSFGRVASVFVVCFGIRIFWLRPQAKTHGYGFLRNDIPGGGGRRLTAAHSADEASAAEGERHKLRQVTTTTS